MARRRRRRREPLWPVLVVGGVLALGVAAGVLLTGGERSDAPTRAIERAVGGAIEEAEGPPTAWDDRVRVEVLNAAGVRGLAARARDELRDHGFDVVYFGNASSFDRDTSVVLDRTARGGGASEVAAALGIARVESAPDTGVYADVTVLLGADWDEAGGPFPSMEADTALEAREEEEPWWDVRRWWRRR